MCNNWDHIDNQGRTAQKLDLLCCITAYLNNSGYTDICSLSEDSKTCLDWRLHNASICWRGSTTAFAVNVRKSWYILVLTAVGFILIVAVILVIAVLVSAQRFSLVCAWWSCNHISVVIIGSDATHSTIFVFPSFFACHHWSQLWLFIVLQMYVVVLSLWWDNSCVIVNFWGHDLP